MIAFLLVCVAPLLLVFSIGLIWAYFRNRRLRYRAIVGYLALAVGQNLPLVAALRAAASHERGRIQEILRLLSSLIAAGSPLSAALRGALPGCPGHVLGALLGAEQSGTLPAVLRSVAADARSEGRDDAWHRSFIPYAVLLLFVISIFIALFNISIAPKFADIAADFGIKPRALTGLANWGNWLAARLALLITAMIAILLAWIQLFLHRQFIGRSPDRFQLGPALLDWIAWHVPLARRAAETRAMALQLTVLQPAVAAGLDLPAAARAAACADANYFARRRMSLWAQQIQSGVPPAEAAAALGFPAAFRAAIRSAQPSGDLGTALDYAHSYYRRLLVHWERLLMALLVPTVTVILGAMVAGIACSVHGALVEVVEQVMDTNELG